MRAETRREFLARLGIAAAASVAAAPPVADAFIQWCESVSEVRLNDPSLYQGLRGYQEKLVPQKLVERWARDLSALTAYPSVAQGGNRMGIAKAVHFKEPKEYTTLVYVDGLSKVKRQKYGSELRKLGVPTRKVQGITKDENNALTRLADAIAGFVRDVLDEDSKDMEKLFKEAIKEEGLIEV